MIYNMNYSSSSHNFVLVTKTYVDSGINDIGSNTNQKLNVDIGTIFRLLSWERDEFEAYNIELNSYLNK